MKLQQLLTVTLYAICWQITHTMFVSHKNCNNKSVGTYVANPGNCHQYIRCNGLRSTLGECPNGTYFNPLVLSCDKSKNACKALETSLHTATVTLTTSATSKPATIPLETTLVVDEDVLATTTTTASSSFDSNMEEDDSNEFDTSSLIINNNLPYPVFMHNAVLATYVRPACNPWLDQAFPHPTNCEYYYYCIRGFLTVRRCSVGYYWDMQRSVCLPRQIARCWSL